MMTCPRCTTGFIYVDLDDARCLNCSHRIVLPQKPIVYREASTVCLCGHPPMDGGSDCVRCRYGHNHAAKVAAGMKLRRACKFILKDGTACGALSIPGRFYCDLHPKQVRERVRRIGPVLSSVQEI